MQVRPGMKPNKMKTIRRPVKAEYVLTGEEQKLVTWLFYLCNFSNFLICLFAFTPLSKINTFLAFLSPYLYFLIRIVLYKIWFYVGYHPLPERKHYRNLKEGMDLPVFTKNTEEYVRVRRQQSLKYQVIYNVYKVAYRTLYFSVLTVCCSVLVYNEEEFSTLEKVLEQVSGGNEGVEKFLFMVFFLLAFLLSWLVYKVGEKIWQSHFYQRYPVKVLLVERDEPIVSVENRE